MVKHSDELYRRKMLMVTASESMLLELKENGQCLNNT